MELKYKLDDDGGGGKHSINAVREEQTKELHKLFAVGMTTLADAT